MYVTEMCVRGQDNGTACGDPRPVFGDPRLDVIRTGATMNVEQM